MPQALSLKNITDSGVAIKSDPLVYGITLTVAACSITYELLIAKSIALLAANTVVWFSVTIGIFLLGLGLGAIGMRWLPKRSEALGALVVVEFMLSILGALGTFAVQAGHMAYAHFYSLDHEILGLLGFFGTSFAFVFAIGTLSGLELPLLIKLANQRSGSDVSHVTLGMDYIGGLIGAVAFPMLLLPALDLFSIGAVVALLNLAMAALLLFTSPARPARRFYYLTLTVLVAGLPLLTLGRNSEIQQYFLKKHYHYAHAGNTFWSIWGSPDELPEIERYSSAYQKIDLVQDPDSQATDPLAQAFSSKFETEPDYPRKHILYLNHDFQTNTSYDEIYHEYFAHVPLMLAGKVPQEILVMGGGDGLLIRELLKHPEIEHITQIDLDTELIRLARTHPLLLRINKGSLNNKRVSTRFMDGFQFVRRTSKRFDAIYIDFPMPADYDLSKLYSREFFHFVLHALSDTGFAVFDATGIGLLSMPDANGRQVIDPGNDWPLYYNTLKAAGAAEIQPYLTTLETDNPRAVDALTKNQLQMSLGPEFSTLLSAAENPAERDVLAKVIGKTFINSLIIQHMMSVQQGFIVFTNKPRPLQRRFVDFPIVTHVLNKQRFDLAFRTNFPQDDEIDWSKVNSIMRPTFPSLPISQLRLPY